MKLRVTRKCPKCGGAGKFEIPFQKIPTYLECNRCFGEGKIKVLARKATQIVEGQILQESADAEAELAKKAEELNA